jgi:hypothetical protein
VRARLEQRPRHLDRVVDQSAQILALGMQFERAAADVSARAVEFHRDADQVRQVVTRKPGMAPETS